jgi:asparagine N-glycosylation enzyme membrane subunit Stt3
MGGDFDNDVQNVFFPLIITWLLLEMIETKSNKKKFIFSSLMGLFTGIFAFAWKGGWWYIFDFVLGVFGLYIAYMVIKDISSHAVKRNLLKTSPFWTRMAIFFGPIVLGIVLLLLLRTAGFVFFGLYALCLFVYFLIMVVRIIRAKMSGKEARHESLLTALIVLAIYLVVSAIFVSIFIGSNMLWSGLLSPLRIASIQQAAKADYWPNVYTTVAELNTSDFSGVISNISFFGGLTNKFNIFFIIAVMGVILCLVKEKPNWKDYSLIIFSILFYTVITRPQFLTLPKLTYLALFVIPIAIGLFLLLEDETVDIQFAIFLILWFVATIYAGTKGVRFIHLLVPAFSVAVGITIGKVFKSVSGLLHKELNVNKLVVQVCVGIILLLLLINPVRSANSLSKGNVPIFDRAWYNAMDAVKADSKPDAIINSWWDFGHFFKYQADRGVTFDGAVQNSPPAHWVGKALSTDDEDSAVGILRMLDCTWNDAYYYLYNETDDSLRSISLVNEVIVRSKEDALSFLDDENISRAMALGLVEKTHCSPPEDYFVTSGDMVGKAGVWAHFGNWDFKKAYIYNSVRGKSRENAISFLKENLGLSEEEADNYYMQVISLTTDREANSWISPWPGYVTTNTVPCQKVNATVLCTLNMGIGQNAQTTTVIEKVIVNLDDMENSSLVVTVFDKTLQQRLAQSFERPRNFLITGEDGFIAVPFPNATFPYDVVVDTYKMRVLIADPLLSRSTFTKLFYFDGIYMTHFDKLFEERSQTQGNVIVWKVDWDGKTPAELEKLKASWGIVPAEKPEPVNEDTGNVTEDIKENVTGELLNDTEEIVNATE